MRLTEKHIGKKVTFKTMQGLYIIPLEVSTSTQNVTKYIQKNEDNTFTEVTKGPLSTGDGFNPWSFYKEDQKVFDFSRFGCNEEAVRDLVKVFDKRYVLKKSK